MRIGYACIALAVPGTELHTTTLRNATPERLSQVCSDNLDALDRMIDYNIRQGIGLLRISSDLIPFASHEEIRFPWAKLFANRLADVGAKINSANLRVSMHPGQYTVLNSPDPGVVRRTILDLAYHTQVLDLLGVGPAHKIILHVGGIYGDKIQALERFSENYQALPEAVRRRLVIENDDRLYTISDVLDLATRLGIPAVYDNLHDAVNPSADTALPAEWIRRAAATWHTTDGPQKIHYSQPNPSRRAGAHSDTIDVGAFVEFSRDLPEDIDIMLEVKDKNISVMKCIACTEPRRIEFLEEEWARYKYVVLEHSAAQYQAIRELLREKNRYPAREMYDRIGDALAQEPTVGSFTNAAQHVWGYFRGKASASEQKRFQNLLDAYAAGQGSGEPVKRMLLRLAQKYEVRYLMESYYFSISI